MKLDDLTPAERRAVQRGEVGAPRARRTAARSTAARGHRCTYLCATCGERSTAWAAAQRHADTHGGARVEIVL